MESEIENDFRFLVGEELTVISVRREKRRNRSHGSHRTYKTYLCRAKQNAANRLPKILLFTLALFATSAQAEEPLHATSEQFFQLPLTGAINVENLDGSIQIFGWYEPRVRLAAVRNAYTAARLKQIRIDTKETPSSLAIRTIIPPAHGLFTDRSGTVDYILNVPEQAQLILHVVNGEILVQGLRGGRARIELGNGRVFLRNCFARIEAHAVHGAMDVFYEWWENAPAVFDLTMDHGRIGALLPVAAKLKLDAATADGHVGNGFGIAVSNTPGPGHAMQGANSPDPPVSFHLRTGGGNISIDSWR